MELSNGPVVRGDRVAIRRFTRADVDQWVAWPRHTDPLFQDYNAPHLSPRERDLWFADRIARPDHAMFAIVDGDDGLIGRLFLRQMTPSQASAVLGVDLRPDAIGQGIGTEALRLFCRYYFCEMGYRVLKLDVAAYNARAQRVYEKLGWVFTGDRWNTYPSVFMPDIGRDPRFDAIRRHFRTSPGSVSVLHHDMELRRERWEALQQGAC
jgi:RimJ/RimL family protein N-acetyltransferase